jgi:hypothetical protein
VRATAAAPVQAKTAPEAAAARSVPEAATVVRPYSIYPRVPVAIDAATDALCGAFQDLPRERRAQCAGQTPGVSLASECKRMLATSIQSGAIALEPAATERCLAASRERYRDCGFTQAQALAPLAACASLWHGTLARGATCRSSLECQRGLHCRGVGPLDTGTCATPEAAGTRCGLGMDPLAAYVPHDDAEHAECAADCERGRCTAAGP